MKLYLVIDRENVDVMNDMIYGVFSSLEKATEIKEQIMQNFIDHDEYDSVDVIELTLDELTEDYHFLMNT